MKIAVLVGFGTFLFMGVFFVVLLLPLFVILSDVISVQTFGYFYRLFALLIMVCTGIFFGWLTYEK